MLIYMFMKRNDVPIRDEEQVNLGYYLIEMMGIVEFKNKHCKTMFIFFVKYFY